MKHELEQEHTGLGVMMLMSSSMQMLHTCAHTYTHETLTRKIKDFRLVSKLLNYLI